jgi:myosin heavy subunit
MNPFKDCSFLLTDELQKDFLSHDLTPEQERQLPPHMYRTAREAFFAMVRTKQNQSVSVSGESGAGKTEATKLVIQYLTKMSAQQAAKTGKVSKNSGSLNDQLITINPVLEAFGNAKTIHNNNSSRFGKLMIVSFTPDGQIAGAEIKTYLLEKSRITDNGGHERNFHFFYNMLKGVNADAELGNLTHLTAVHGHTGSHRDFVYLAGDEVLDHDHNHVNKRTSRMDVEGPLDLSFWFETKKALSDLGIDDHHQREMLVILSGILFTGGIEFEEKLNTDGTEELVVSESSQEDFDICASLWKVPKDDLMKVLTQRSMKKAGGFGRGSVIMIAYDVASATANVLSIVKKLYADLFDWLVFQINTKLQANLTNTEQVQKAPIYIIL